ncbi:MAG: Brp/Blh family beta-carotene 15,15'-dioxygenase [Bacteroidota bacterium]
MSLPFRSQLYLLAFGWALALLCGQTSLPQPWQWGFFILTIVGLGIPHGALDFIVARHNAENQQQGSYSLSRFLFLYVGQSILFLFLWIWPPVALTLFLIFSAMHFGETDLQEFRLKPSVKAIAVFLYGASTFILLLLGHDRELITYIPEIGDFINRYPFLTFAIDHFNTIYRSTLFSSLILLLLFSPKDETLFFRLMVLVLVQYLVANLPFLIGFAFYFGLWHSLLSIQAIRQEAQFSTFHYMRRYFTPQTILFAGLAFVILVGLYLLIDRYYDYSNGLFIFFIGLSILAIPHMQVMHGFFSRPHRP